MGFSFVMSPSVIIRDLDVAGIAFAPLETDEVLVVDPDGVLTPPFSCKCFKPVTRRHSQIIQLRPRANYDLFAPRHALDRPPSGDSLIVEELFRLPRLERFDHLPI